MMALKHARPGDVMHLQPPRNGVAAAGTAALVKSDGFEAVRLVVPAGTLIPEHKVDGFVTIYCLSGRVVLGIDRDVELRAGDWTYLDRGAPHDVQGIEDSALLVTILFD